MWNAWRTCEEGPFRPAPFKPQECACQEAVNRSKLESSMTVENEKSIGPGVHRPIVLWPGGFADSLYAWPAYGIASSAGSVAASPEPDSFLLIGVGLAALFTLGALHLPRPVETPARSGDSPRP